MGAWALSLLPPMASLLSPTFLESENDHGIGKGMDPLSRVLE